MKKKYLWSLLVLVFVGFVVKISWDIGWSMGRQHEGVCLELGRALTDDEKIRAVIKEMNRPVTSVNMSFLEGKEINRDDIAYARLKRIPYGSIDEFLKENPDCCSVAVQDKHYGSEENWDFSKAMGAYSGHVTVNYRINYIDDNGYKKQKLDRRVYTVQNCGVVN